MELKWIVRAQADVQTRFEEIRKRITFVGQEQSIVAKRRHGKPNLLQVEEIL
jgi:hypothetical protein